ncbi:MAG TPA: hypothetical protein VGE92_00430, partial [Steroidobacteraceae bacterium]
PATNAGTVTLNAANGTVQLGLPTDTTQTSLSSSAGVSAGAAGAVTIRGAAIDLGDALVATTVAGSTPSTTRGTIVLDANGGSGALTVANSTLNATTSGATQAGEIDLLGNPIVISNSTISSKTTGTAAAGSICVGSGTACVPAAAVVTSAPRSVIHAPAASPGSIAISASTLSTSTSTSGNAGNIDVISTGALALSAATIESQSTSPSPTNAGTVGIITLTGAPVSITNHSLVSTTSVGNFVPGETSGGGTAPPATTPGTAITINSTGGVPLQISDSSVNASAGLANGSNIAVNAGGGPIELQGSTLLASANAGNGGNITINDAGNTTLQQSGILARATAGNGGAINIKLNKGAVFVEDAASLVSATSQTGNNGTVTISGPQTNFQSSLYVPEVSAAKPPELSANACQRDSSHSTFVREGQGGVAPAPDDYVTGRAAGAPAGESAALRGGPTPALAANSPVRLAGCK